MLPIFGFHLNVGVGHVLEHLPAMPKMVTQVQKESGESRERKNTPPLYLSRIYSLLHAVFLGKFWQ